MDPNYKPSSSLDVSKLPPKKSSPRFSMANNVATPFVHSPENYKLICKKKLINYFNICCKYNC